MAGGKVYEMTVRQRSVCDLLIRGFSNKEIARQIGIGARTVESHRGIIFRKAGVRNAVELARKMLGAQDV